MEQKTIGKFITALRKANGMTQRELAEQLNVSDKTVSRWECDNGAPDLAVIPVLAEIFGVTCDELLRGERASAEQRANTEPDERTPRGEKQRRRLLSVALAQYRSRTYITMGISVVGLIAALIGNLAFLKAVLGFLLGAVFFVASIVCQAVFLNRAFLSVEDGDLEQQALSEYKRRVIRLTQQSIGLTVAFFGFTFPLILVDAYVGLGADSLLLFGLLGAAAFLLLWAVALYFINGSLLKRGVYILEEKEEKVYRHNRRWKARCAAVLGVVLTVTALCHHVMTSIWGPYSIMKGTTFTEYETFVAFMEQDIPAERQTYSDYGTVETVPEPTQQIGQPQYYDQYGNEITEEQAMTRTLKDRNGKVVCTYLDRNETVISLRYSAGEGTVLPITVCTQQDLRKARSLAASRHVLFTAVYCVEVLAVIALYFKKRMKA